MKEKYKNLLYLFLKILSVSVIAILLGCFVFGITINKQNNMYPRVSEGDLIFYYRMDKNFLLGDVIVLNTGEKTICSRVIAKEGDIVDFTKDGRILVNNMPVDLHNFNPKFKNDKSNIKYPLIIQPDEYFILSDNGPEDEFDSRTLGPIKQKYIKGKTITVMRRRGF